MNAIERIFLIVLALGTAACSRPVPRLPGEAERTEAWSDAAVDKLAAVPLQDNGRVKPLATLAAFKLYQIHGRRDLKYSIPAADGGMQKVTLEPTEWLLDVWFYPEQAADYPLFRIEHTGVLDALGFENDGQRQDFDWLSYKEIGKVFGRFRELAGSYVRIEQKDRNTVQEHIVQLWRKFIAYDSLHSSLDPFRVAIPIGDPAMEKAMGGASVSIGTVLAKADAFRAVYRERGPEATSDEALLNLGGLLQRLIDFDSEGPQVVPPVFVGGAADETWKTVGQGIDLVLRGASGDLATMLVSLQDAVSVEGQADKEAALGRYADASVAMAEAASAYDKVELETAYYRQSWHYKSIHWFLFGFVLAAVCWLLPRNRLLWWASMGVTALALAFLSYDVLLRCLITDRPPIKNLYDTFLFIAAIAVLMSMVAEFVLPRRIALAAAPFLGALLVMFARLFEVSNASDTMDPLVAVLDSNFWLATHVTTINIGYAAGLVAALLANIWILLRVFRIAHPEDASAKALCA